MHLESYFISNLVLLVTGRSAAWLAHWSGGPGVGGSNPLAPTILLTFFSFSLFFCRKSGIVHFSFSYTVIFYKKSGATHSFVFIGKNEER